METADIVKIIKEALPGMPQSVSNVTVWHDNGSVTFWNDGGTWHLTEIK